LAEPLHPSSSALGRTSHAVKENHSHGSKVNAGCKSIYAAAVGIARTSLDDERQPFGGRGIPISPATTIQATEGKHISAVVATFTDSDTNHRAGSYKVK
jgi:hypothetical protein